MGEERQSHEELQRKNFRKKLASCVRRIQWSYAIFWSFSNTDFQGSLEWKEGYYNGEIKTRKTTQQTESNADEMGIQRSEQLRELYECLCKGDLYTQSRRPSASLSPEDLTDAEWYYLICMSFTFDFGQDLPGKVYECNMPIWLNDIQSVEIKKFSRSLLAKSACIQTVVCLPFMDGVLELGTSNLVLEDPGFLHSIMNSFWELPVSLCSQNSTSSSLLAGEGDNVCSILDHEVYNNKLRKNHVLNLENNSHVIPEDFPNAHEGLLYINKHLEVIHDQNGSLSFSECVSSSLAQNNLSSPFDDSSHYAITLSSILGNLKQGTPSLSIPFQSGFNNSSFKAWKNGSNGIKKIIKTPQKLLKKILFDGKWMNDCRPVTLHEEIMPLQKTFRSETDNTNVNHVLSERRRREKLNEKFLILRSMVPSISRVDKASILADTIEYLKELERRVEELEFYREDKRERRKHQDITERTSDNYGNNGLTKKRKVSEAELCFLSSKNGVCDINVAFIDEEVLVELHCPCRDFQLHDIVEAFSKLHLDAHSLRSTTVDSTIAIAARAKFMGREILSPGMIKRALQRVIGKGHTNSLSSFSTCGS